MDYKGKSLDKVKENLMQNFELFNNSDDFEEWVINGMYNG